RDPLENCFASPKANNCYEWVSTIVNASEILLDFIGSFYKVNISLPRNYPLKPLKIMWK
ncbi:hypothetical protein SELMODRAFT_28318, partial [Selaginella moellendorffii]